MKVRRRILCITILFMFGSALLVGCDALGLGSGGGEGGSEAGDGDGALDPIDLSDDAEGGEANGEMDEIDLSTTCPSEPNSFSLSFDYLLEYNDQNGFVREKTDPMGSITIVVEGEDAYQPFTGAQAETIPGTIEGQIGECQVDGMFEFSFLIVGVCEDGIVTLDITGTYEIYQRRIVCGGQVAENFTDSLVDGPGALVTFNLTTNGDTFPTSLDLGIAKIEYTWTLAPLAGLTPLTD